MEDLKIYRKRLIPSECIWLKNDIVLLCNEEFIVTRWNTLRPRKDFSHGFSVYCLKEGIKVSKFYKPDESLLYWYCDIVDYDINVEENTCTTTDLLVDVLVYPDGSSRILDLDELADAHEQKLIDDKTLYEALKRADKLVSDIYAGKFNKYRKLVESLEQTKAEQ
ncbi:MAG: DUF402 domain-containing protein [Lachnospiraceae bacterium]|nr:DUF402 domain-containing protein [Lachnospiraceae bacterium]